tara:strand:- start:8329 stop:9954 length:1626 start_codon:yes stop_codon:yes gene_type:complete
MNKYSGSLLVVALIIVASVILTPKASVNNNSSASFAEQVIEEKKEPHQPLPAPSVEVEMLRRDISGFLDGTRLRSAKWSVMVVSLDMGDTLFARNENLQVTPASNMKIVTTAAALYFLGPSFKYQTFLFGDGPIENGHLRGDLILYGTGDPGISDRFFPTRTRVFEGLAKQLVAEGITHIDGDIVGDATYFSGPALGPEWNPKDFNERFAAPVSSISFNENVVTLRISPANRLGGVPTVETIPYGFNFETHNTAKTVSGRPRPKLWLDRPTPTSTARIAGEITHGGPAIWRRLTVPDPALFAVQALKRTLVSNNITVGGNLISVHRSDLSKITGKKTWSPGIMKEKEPRILARHTSPEIIEYLKVVNHESHNLFAESIFKTIGKIVVGQGSFQGGSRAIRNFTVGEIGLSDNELVSADGSGFSHNNQTTAGGLVKILWYMSGSPQWNNFVSTLPEAGRSLRRMYRTQAARNLRAKTGTIERVSGLTGLVSARNGEKLLFSIISNNVPSTSSAKRVEDRIGSRLANFWRSTPDSSRILSSDQ